MTIQYIISLLRPKHSNHTNMVLNANDVKLFQVTFIGFLVVYFSYASL